MKVYCSCGWLLPLSSREIQAVLNAMLACSPQPGQDVEVYVVRDGSMAQHNQRCLGCTGPTNVLSFPSCAAEPVALSGDATLLSDTTCLRSTSSLPTLRSTSSLPTLRSISSLPTLRSTNSLPTLGSISSLPTSDLPATLLLSADTLRRECFLYGQSPHEHLLRLLAHGMGHLMGLDHSPDMDHVCDQFFAAGMAATKA